MPDIRDRGHLSSEPAGRPGNGGDSPHQRGGLCAPGRGPRPGAFGNSADPRGGRGHHEGSAPEGKQTVADPLEAPMAIATIV